MQVLNNNSSGGRRMDGLLKQADLGGFRAGPSIISLHRAAEKGMRWSGMEIFTFLGHYGFLPLSEGLGACPKSFLDKALEAQC